ncbi:toxin-antitoxin system YwqK family antitoxin, partial [Xanthovirga aplysinae]|uniref:toxin-antitoxin system YwqK family antitoxin n=1 Tax=Xanthovirga aplysinae TaxID=2529853 RepID=UPI0012BC1914
FFFQNIIVEGLYAQGKIIKTYYDLGETKLKEMYTISSFQPNYLEGKYEAFFSNGNIRVEGQYRKNVAVGLWNYYYENGQLKMSGTLLNNKPHGLWKYYFEGGKEKMRGEMKEGMRENEWLFNYESGKLKSKGFFRNGRKTGNWENYFEEGGIKSIVDYDNEPSAFKEYFLNGKLKGEGWLLSQRADSLWVYYHENGMKQAEGKYRKGQKSGIWNEFHESGQLAAEGEYLLGLKTGEWKYYDKTGAIQTKGYHVEGLKQDHWELFDRTGQSIGEIFFEDGRGNYKEYYKNGSIKAKGQVEGEQFEGEWHFYYEDGTIEGKCYYRDNMGYYTGFYRDGNLKTKGAMEGSKKVGSWELYRKDGILAGYYKPVYNAIPENFETVTNFEQEEKPVKSQKPDYLFKRRHFKYFKARINEFRGIFISSNPFLMPIGRVPFSVEYYMQERLGYELQYHYFRSQFFIRDSQMPLNDIYHRGYDISFRQKFYQEDKDIGMLYFAHEVFFLSLNQFVKVSDSSLISKRKTFNKADNSLGYAILVGNKLIRDAGNSGLTFDLYLGIGLARRIGKKKYDEVPEMEEAFESLPKGRIYFPIRFGVNIGYTFKGFKR